MSLQLEKKALASNPRNQWENDIEGHTMRKSRQVSFQPAFKLCDVLEWENNPASPITKLLATILKNEILKAQIFYQNKIKTYFIHLFQIFYWVL